MVSHAALNAKVARQAADLARSSHGFVATPTEVAEQMVSWPYQTLRVPGCKRVLEPSAGTGVLVGEILDTDQDVELWAVEPDRERALRCADTARAAERRYTVREAHTGGVRLAGEVAPGTVTVVHGSLEDFTGQVQAGGAAGLRFDAVVMNPPWSLPGQPRLWVEHVLAGWDLLLPGGRLVAAVPSSTSFGRSATGRRLEQLVADHGGIDQVDVDREAVRAGFPARACLLWLVQPMTTDDGRPSWLLHPTPGPAVPVERLDLTPHAAQAVPVQEYTERLGSYRRRVIRYAGTCHGCTRLLWAHDDGQEDASMWVAECLDPQEYDLCGPQVGLCIECRSHRERSERAMADARRYWTAPERAAAGR